MNYPKEITLIKINTREDAEQPQKEKYPDGTERNGLMWEFSKPKVGESFMVLISKLLPTFITSPVTEILEKTEKQIIFKTINSTYRLIWK